MGPGPLAGFPVKVPVALRHSQYRKAGPASSMPPCWAVQYSRLQACESCDLRLCWEAATGNCDGAYILGAAVGTVIEVTVGCERGERETRALSVERRFLLPALPLNSAGGARLFSCAGSAGLAAGSQQ